MASRVIDEYFGYGLLSARPVTPNVDTGVAALYYATDTGVLYVWDGSWHPVGGGAAPTVVQRKIGVMANLSTGLTLDAPPSSGNKLFAFILNSTAVTPPGIGSGWTTVIGNTTAPDVLIAAKTAGGSESATQNPTNSTDGGVICIYEVTGWTWWISDAELVTTSASPTLTNAYYGGNLSAGIARMPMLANGLAIGFMGRRSDQNPSGFTGSGTAIDVSASDNGGIVGGSGIAMSTFTHSLVLATSSYSTVGSYAGSQATRIGVVLSV